MQTKNRTTPYDMTQRNDGVSYGELLFTSYFIFRRRIHRCAHRKNGEGHYRYIPFPKVGLVPLLLVLDKFSLPGCIFTKGVLGSCI